MQKEPRFQKLHSSHHRSVMELLESSDPFTKHHRFKRGQRRSRKALLWVLLSFLMILVLVTNLFTSARGSGLDWNSLDTDRTNPFHRHERRLSSIYRSGEILVGDYEEIREYYQQVVHYNREQQADDSSPSHSHHWSDEQIEEMERYYKRYLQVFVETHGDQYEPESKEVVYAEYLKYLNHKEQQKGRAEQEQAAQATRQRRKLETTPPEGSSTKQVEEETPNKSPSDQSMTKNDPFYLETDWEHFNEVGGDNLNQSNNSFTRTILAAAIF